MGKLKLTISSLNGALMVAVALVFDGLQALVDLLSVGTLGWLVNPFINFWSFMTFYTWFKLQGVTFVRPAKLATMGGTFITELIPWINSLPTWTAAVATMLAMVYAEDLVAAVAPDTLEGLSRFALDRKTKKAIRGGDEKKEEPKTEKKEGGEVKENQTEKKKEGEDKPETKSEDSQNSPPIKKRVGDGIRRPNREEEDIYELPGYASPDENLEEEV